MNIKFLTPLNEYYKRSVIDLIQENMSNSDIDISDPHNLILVVNEGNQIKNICAVFEIEEIGARMKQVIDKCTAIIIG